LAVSTIDPAPSRGLGDTPARTRTRSSRSCIPFVWHISSRFSRFPALESVRWRLLSS
jgi:hypothetical protein